MSAPDADVPVAEGKEDFVALLDEGARRLSITAKDLGGRLTLLERRCNLGNGTLRKAVARKGYPRYETLEGLAKCTEIPVIEWEFHLHLHKPEDIARALDRRAPTLSERDLAWLDFLQSASLP